MSDQRHDLDVVLDGRFGGDLFGTESSGSFDRRLRHTPRNCQCVTNMYINFVTHQTKRFVRYLLTRDQAGVENQAKTVLSRLFKQLNHRFCSQHRRQ